MSFYPLVNNEAQLRELDGWLVSVIDRAVRLRGRLLHKWGYSRFHVFPFVVDRENLVAEYKKNLVNGLPRLEVPSFLLIYKAIQKGVQDQGIEGVMNPASKNYDY